MHIIYVLEQLQITIQKLNKKDTNMIISRN